MICPCAYRSITKIDLKVLDQFMIKPIGVYGPTTEIVRLLRSLDVVSEDMCVIFGFVSKSPRIIRLLVLVCYLCQLSTEIPCQPYRPVYMS
jgi:hypothetical protein